MCRKRTAGYSFLELITTLSVSSVLLGIGLPAMAGLINANRMSIQINHFVSALAMARTEAIYQNYNVVICQSEDHQNCSAGEWTAGWIVFVDEDANHQRTDDEAILLTNSAVPRNMQITYRGFGSRHFVVFRGTGATSSNGSFIFCDRQNHQNSRALIINRTGRVRISEVRSDGGPIVCT